MAVVIFFKYFGLRALISSKLISSGGCIILEVVPVVGINVDDLDGSFACVLLALLPGVFVVGGALIVALLSF